MYIDIITIKVVKNIYEALLDKAKRMVFKFDIKFVSSKIPRLKKIENHLKAPMVSNIIIST